jgi:hypothetical protein
MFHRVLFAWRVRVGCTAGLLILAAAAAAPAQSLNDGLDVLNKKKSETRDRTSKIFGGQLAMDPKAPEDLEAVDVAAKLVTYRYLLEVGNEKEPGKLDRIFRDLETDLKYIDRVKEKSPDLGKVYSHDVTIHALEVLNFASAKPVVRVNVARTLARLAVLGQGELADALVEALRTPRKQEDGRDGVRYWLLRGLHDLLILPPQKPPLFDEDKVAVALLEFLAEPPFVSKEAPAEEVEGYRMLRREAVRALAQTHKPKVNDKALPALVLAKFAGNDESIQPPPRLDERLEAALGLARMRPSKQVPDYQADYAAQQVLQFLSAFGSMANANKEEKAGFRRPRPWRIDAIRLTEALTALKAEVKDPYVAKAVDVGLRITAAVSAPGTTVKVQAADLAWITDPDHAAPNQELFKGVQGTAVKPAPVEVSAEK